MTLISDIQEQLISLKIKRELSNERALNKQTIISTHDVRSLGILVLIQTHEDINSAYKLVNFFREQHHIDFRILALYAEKGNTPRIFEPSLDIIDLKDLDWMGVPKANRVKYFLTQGFDMLINLNVEHNIALNFLAASTRAKIKIGRYAEKSQKIYDIMVSPTKERNIEDLTNNIIHYLRLVQ